MREILSQNDEMDILLYGRIQPREKPRYVIEEGGPRCYWVRIDCGNGMTYGPEYGGAWRKWSLKAAQAKGELELARYIRDNGGSKRRWEGSI